MHLTVIPILQGSAFGFESWLTIFCLYPLAQSIVDELVPDLPEVGKKATPAYCVSLAWSADGATLYSGYTDGQIRVWTVGHAI